MTVTTYPEIKVLHKLLERQLEKHFGSIEAVPESLRQWLVEVDEAYEKAEVDRRRLESIHPDSRELVEANATLRREAQELEQRARKRTMELMRSNASLEREVAERRVAELALRESEQRYQILADNSPTGIFHSDVDGKTLYVNKKWCELNGLTVHEALNRRWITELQPEQTPDGEESGDGVAAQGREFCIQRPDGETLWVVGYSAALHDRKGRVMGYVGTVTDITERRLAEEAIRQSEEKYRALFEGSRDTVFISTPQGQVLDMNPAGIELLGYSSKEEILKVDLGRQIYARGKDRQEFLDTLTREGFIKDQELRIRKKNGDPLTVLVTATPVCNDDGEVMAIRGMLRDVTEQRRLELQLRQAQKMEAVGRLAGGVAHEFNNLLTAIIGYCDLATMATSADDPVHQHSQEIKSAATRGGHLTRQLLALSRRQVLSPKVLNLNAVVSEMEALLSRVIGEHIELISDLDPELGSIHADPSQLEQVILNLTINAREAMPDGGTITLRTTNVEVTRSGSGRLVGLKPGKYVRFSARDTGIGIDEGIKDQVFEPFVTTKKGDRASGLGLATVYAIVQQSGGQIDVNSAPGSTSFEICFPRIDRKPEPAARSLLPGPSPVGHETILLVEDEIAVRSALTQVLRRQGYRVWTACDGQEGLELAMSHDDGSIGLLLSDVVMPRMNGIELARRLKEDRKDLKILLISGYTDREYFADELFDDPRAHFLQKPFSTQVLGQKVREILASDPGEEAEQGDVPSPTMQHETK